MVLHSPESVTAGPAVERLAADRFLTGCTLIYYPERALVRYITRQPNISPSGALSTPVASHPYTAVVILQQVLVM